MRTRYCSGSTSYSLRRHAWVDPPALSLAPYPGIPMDDEDVAPYVSFVTTCGMTLSRQVPESRSRHLTRSETVGLPGAACLLYPLRLRGAFPCEQFQTTTRRHQPRGSAGKAR